MSQAFCQQCGSRRENDAALRCSQCGAVFPVQATTPDVPSDEAPTRIAGRPAQSPQQPQQTPTPPAPHIAPGAPNAAAPQPGMPNPAYGAPQPGAPQPGAPQAGAHLAAQQPGYGTVPPQGWQQPQPGFGQQQWSGAPGQHQGGGSGSGKGKLWILLAAAVLVIGGGITALVIALGGGGGGGDDDSNLSDEEQIEQVITDYNDATQKLQDGDASACDAFSDLVTEELSDDDLASCRDSATGDGSDEYSYEVKYKSAEIDGDTAVATVETVSSFGDADPTTSSQELHLRKVDGDWKLDFDANSSSDSGSSDVDPSQSPSDYSTEDYDYDDPTESPSDYSTYDYDDPSESPSN